MESDHMKVEETATGARFTFTDMNFFKKDNGNYYPFYVVNYYLMPRNLQALAELERMVIDNGNNPVAFDNTASCRGNTASAIAHYTKKNSLKPVTKDTLTMMSIRPICSQGIILPLTSILTD